MSLFFLKPILTVLLIAIISGLLGVFVLWKKMAYFGDAISHSMLLAVVLSAFLQINQSLMFLLFAGVFAFICATILHSKIFTRDSLVMILSYFSIASAFIVSDIFLPNFNFTSYIFGDLMTVSTNEVIALSIVAFIVIIYSFLFYKKILLINIDSDLAKIEQIKIKLINVSFLALLIVTISLTVQMVGVFLITALLILPSTIARIFARSPLAMLILSLIIAIIFSLSAFKISEVYNLTISATIVLTLIAVFLLSLIFKSISKFFYEKL
jgi:zinc transport system permease protein